MKGQITKTVTALSLGLSFVFAGYAAGAAVLREDLSACELPHGTVEMPEEGSPLASQQRGYIFNFETKRLLFVSEQWDPGSYQRKDM